MFHCKAYRCNMEERHCVHYQDIVRGMDTAAFWVGDSAGRGVVAYRHHCVKCEQGREVAANYKPATPGAASPPQPQNVGAGFIPARKEESMAKQCIVEGCTRNVVGQGLCGPHYDKWRRGDPEVVKVKGAEFKVIRPLKRKNVGAGLTPARKESPPAPLPPVGAETKPVRAEVSKREQSPKGNGQIQVPDFEAKVLYAIARNTGATITECFLRCLRKGIEAELGAI